MPRGSLRRGFFVLALGSIRQHPAQEGDLRPRTGRAVELVAATVIVVFAKEPTARRNLVWDPVSGVYLSFLFGAWAPFNSDGLEALYRDWEHNPIIWKWFARHHR